MFVDSNVIDFFAKEMVLVKINAEADSMLKKRYRISGYPTLVLANKDGIEIDRIVGYLPADTFLKTLRDYSNGIGTLDDLLGRAETETGRSLYYEIANKYKYRGAPAEAETWFGRVIEAGNPRDSLSGKSRMAIADMFRRAKDYDQALDEYNQIMIDFEGTMTAQNGEIYRAITYRQKGDTSDAITAFEGFIMHYPESKDTTYALKQIEKLKSTGEEDN